LKTKTIYYLSLILATTLVLSCDPPASQSEGAASTETPTNTVEAAPKSTSKIPYDLTNPASNLKLSHELKEISGLSLSTDGNYLLTINDEKGRIFYLDKNTGKITRSYPFYKNGDYEGVEMVGDSIYVTQNNGTIYAFAEGAENASKKYKTKLKSENDVEGLGYAAAKNALVLACKAKHKGGKEYKGSKTFHLFDLASSTLEKKPFFAVFDQQLLDFYNQNNDDNKVVRVLKSERVRAFSPSAIAQHPISKDWYILSSVGKLLVVIDDVMGELKTVHFLNKQKHLQPEGLCFDKNGDMYISNEAKGVVAKLYKFLMLEE